MNTLEIKTDILRYILSIEDDKTLIKLLEYVKKNTPKDKPKNLTKYRGSINTGLSVSEIDKQLKDIRDEWERDIY